MKHSHGHGGLLALTLMVFLILGFSGCSKTSDPGKLESKSAPTDITPVKDSGSEELKQIYLVFIDEFKMKPFGQEDEERYAPNQRVASRAIDELERISDTIQDPGTREIHSKFLGLLKEYNDAAQLLENAIQETKSAKEELNRREEEIREQEKAEGGSFKYFSEKTEILEKRSNLADYGNIGVKKSKVESLETALYWLHKDFGIEGLKK
jgi:hypothetical protein